jgi:protein SCO1/2
MTREVRLAIGAVGWLAVAIGGAVLAVQASRRDAQPDERELAPIGHIAPFELTDQDGRPFGSESLRSRVWIAGFAFSSCTSICPMLTSQMANVQRRIARHGDAVHMVTVTVDPETDTPERLREFAGRHRADLAHWSFLTGQPDQVRHTLTRGFMVAVGDRHETEGGGYDILHTGALMLVDRELALIGLYETDEEGLDRLVRDVDTLVAR